MEAPRHEAGFRVIFGLSDNGAEPELFTIHMASKVQATGEAQGGATVTHVQYQDPLSLLNRILKIQTVRRDPRCVKWTRAGPARDPRGPHGTRVGPAGPVDTGRNRGTRAGPAWPRVS